MDTILQNEAIGKLPVTELITALEAFMEPVVMQLPDKRLRAVGQQAVQGNIGGQSSLVTQMARGVAREEETIWPMAKRLYQFMWNRRFSHRDLLKGLYGIAQRSVAERAPSRLVVALDPVNFEKPYTEELEGVSTPGLSTWFSGSAVWVVNWACLQTLTVRTSSWLAFVPSSSPSPL
jgi:hypothetical protein